MNLFFGEKLNEAARRFTQLKNDVELQQKTEAKQKHKQQQRKIQQQNENDENKNGLRHRRQSQVSPAKFLKLGTSNEEKSTLKTVKELKLAFTEFYLALVLIQNYQVCSIENPIEFLSALF